MLIAGVVVAGLILFIVLLSGTCRPKQAAPAYVPTNMLVNRANKAYDAAWNLQSQAGPEAPPAGRTAAAKQALKLLAQCQATFETVLARKISDSLRQRIENRLRDVQGQIYWYNKLTPVE